MPQVQIVSVYLDSLLTWVNPPNANIRLFKVNHTPSPTDVLADYTGTGDEADFSGYGANGISWMGVTQTGNKAFNVRALAEFAHNGGGVSNNIYGFFISHSSTDRIYAYRFPDAPRVMSALGDSIIIKPYLELYDDGDEVASQFIINENALLVHAAEIFGTNRYSCHLYTAGTISDSNVVGDFTEVTAGNFPGYTWQGVTFSTSAFMSAGYAVRVSNLITFTRSSGAGTTTILGYYLRAYNGGGTGEFVGAQAFASPTTVDTIGQSVSFNINGLLASIN